ncbi:MAG: sortase [Clostridia bacterium]|nr:sortase [Clostridia bacterium]
MNQILVTEKLYVTPELKRKKKMYKFNFFLSVFLVCSLFSYYIYAEYDRNRNEEVSKEILASIDLKYYEEEEKTKNSDVRMEDNVLIVTLGGQLKEREEINITKLAASVQSQIENKKKEKEIFTTETGDTYSTDAVLNIPSLEINYPILDKTTNELLKISLTKFWGGDPNEVGNYVIVGHNYRNKKMFGRLSEIQIGDKVELTDLEGRTLSYEVYEKYTVNPDDTACTSQHTNGKKEITLITCTNYGTQRLVVKAREIK